ncbi:hypothetical protein ACFFS2_05415 [Streptomyces aurantiacus]|uniref:Leucine rich repeat variant n=1 Tax=Streptomyces aurantiacus TaxID=47760 RepID=A0A7G1P4W3_9ACTN|nr:hypothetical protein GCM10017557_37160 [Streptomyces aurantiacus]
MHHILCGLAANPALPSELVDRLIAVADDDIAWELACRADLNRTQAVALAERVEGSAVVLVLLLVAQRRDLPSGIRDRLAADPDAKVVKALAPHPGLTEARLRAMVDRHGVRVLAKVATNPDASPALLEDLVRRRPTARKVFREVARHRGATDSSLLVCLTDHQARPMAAGHPALPPPAIVELLADTDRQVAETAAANPSLPLAVLSDLVRGQ